MSHCAVYGCSSNSNHKDLIRPLDPPIVIDDHGSCFDGLDTKFFSLPSLPKSRGKYVPRPEEIRQVEDLRKRWIHLLRRSDRLPKSEKDVYVCSRHFARDAYDSFVPMRQGQQSFLSVARSSPKLKLLLPSAVPTLNLPMQQAQPSSNRAERYQAKERQECVEDAIINR